MANVKPKSEKLDFEKVWLMFQETKEIFKQSSIEYDRKFQETKELMARSSLETDRKFQETKELLAQSSLETDRRLQETDGRLQETDKQIKELGKQIGGLGNKFGTYNEGLFSPSVRKILETEFKCYETSPNDKFQVNGDSFEIDFVGYSATACYIVEIKSHLDLESLKQLERIIENFKKYKPEYKNKKIFGVITATHFNKSTYQKALKDGFYVIIANDELAELQLPEGFKPKSW
jgi:hypothetical protein